MINLSRENSSVIKGIVIMMMVFYHLFGGNHMIHGVNPHREVPLAT